MWHSHLNVWKFLKQKDLFPEALNWVQHWVSRIGLLLFLIPARLCIIIIIIIIIIIEGHTSYNVRKKNFFVNTVIYLK